MYCYQQQQVMTELLLFFLQTGDSTKWNMRLKQLEEGH